MIVSLGNFQIGSLALCLSDKHNTKHRFVFFFIQRCDFFAWTEMPKMNKKQFLFVSLAILYLFLLGPGGDRGSVWPMRPNEPKTFPRENFDFFKWGGAKPHPRSPRTNPKHFASADFFPRPFFFRLFSREKNKFGRDGGVSRQSELFQETNGGINRGCKNIPNDATAVTIDKMASQRIDRKKNQILYLELHCLAF